MNVINMPRHIFLGFLVFGSAVLQLVLTCAPKPEGSPLLQEKVTFSDIVVHGVVTKHMMDGSLPTAYTAVFDVHCVYKGGPLPPVINVINAGYVSDKCVSAELPVGDKKLVYLRRDRGGNYSPTFTDDPATTKYLDELRDTCGITNKYIYPTGITATTAKVDCRPERYILHDDCPVEITPSRPEEFTPRSSAVRMSLSIVMLIVLVCMTVLSLQ